MYMEGGRTPASSNCLKPPNADTRGGDFKKATLNLLRVKSFTEGPGIVVQSGWRGGARGNLRPQLKPMSRLLN